MVTAAGRWRMCSASLMQTIGWHPVVCMVEGVSREREAGRRVPGVHARPVAGHGPARVRADRGPGPCRGRGAGRVRAGLRVLAEGQPGRRPRRVRPADRDQPEPEPVPQAPGDRTPDPLAAGVRARRCGVDRCDAALRRSFGADRGAAAAGPATAGGDRAPLLDGPDRTRDRGRPELLRRHGQEPGVTRPGHVAAGHGTGG